jgi:PPOX class probable F420-dependent enzyme
MGGHDSPMDEPVVPTVVSTEQDEYLRTHCWALLCTTRADGSPQSSMVAYHWDGTDLVVSTRDRAAKVANLRRLGRALAAVADDRRFLSVSGPVTIISGGDELHELTARLHASLGPSDQASLQRDLDAGLEEVGRVIVRLVPDKVLGRI